MRIHSGEKPFLCEFENCGKSFVTQGHLNNHIQKHQIDKTFECTICCKSYSNHNILKKHLSSAFHQKRKECNEYFDKAKGGLSRLDTMEDFLQIIKTKAKT